MAFGNARGLERVGRRGLCSIGREGGSIRAMGRGVQQSKRRPRGNKFWVLAGAAYGGARFRLEGE